MQHLIINRSKLRHNWKKDTTLQLEKVYESPLERIYESPDMRISVGLKWAYLFVFSDDDYQRICASLLRQ